MTAEQQKLCRGLIIYPPGLKVWTISKDEFLRQFPSSVERGKLSLRVLEEACETQSADDLVCALIVGFAFGFALEDKDILRPLVGADWHCSHEDVVTALKTWPSPDTVEALFCATQWVPKSLEYDNTRALAVKAIWALGKVPGPEAETKLKVLALSDDAILRKTAKERLEERRLKTV